MTGAAVRETVTLAGLAERARVARTFVGAVLGPGHPCGDDAALLVRALRQQPPAQPVGRPRRADHGRGQGQGRRGARRGHRPGRPRGPELHEAGQDAEGGRGLGLVAALSARWGWRRRGGRTVTWFELRHG